MTRREYIFIKTIAMDYTLIGMKIELEARGYFINDYWFYCG